MVDRPGSTCSAYRWLFGVHQGNRNQPRSALHSGFWADPAGGGRGFLVSLIPASLPPLTGSSASPSLRNSLGLEQKRGRGGTIRTQMPRPCCGGGVGAGLCWPTCKQGGVAAQWEPQPVLEAPPRARESREAGRLLPQLLSPMHAAHWLRPASWEAGRPAVQGRAKGERAQGQVTWPVLQRGT